MGPRRATRTGPLLVLVALAAAALAGSGCGSDGVRVRWVGDQHVGRASLAAAARRELADFQAHPGEPALADAAYAMEQELRQQGFAHARVGFRLLPTPERPELALFEVAEGPRAYLERLDFPGAHRFPHEQLRGLLKADGVGLFRLFDAPFRRRDLQDCAKSVEALYLLDGWYRVRVGRPEVTFSEDRRHAHVLIPVEEGRRYVVGSVAVEADLAGSGMTRADLDPALAGAEIVGDAYHARLPALAAARIRQWLADRGRLDATAVARIEIDDAAATVAVTYAVRPGPVYVLRGVVAVGLDRTKSGFVEDRLRAVPGRPISSGGIDEGVRELSRSGAFSSVRWRAVPVDPAGGPAPGAPGADGATLGPAGTATGAELGPAGTATGAAARTATGDGSGTRLADLRLTVTEAEARTVDFEIGYGTYEQLRGGIRYRDRNLFGQGRFWEVHPSASMKSWGAETRVRDDYLVGKQNVAELALGYRFREEPTFLEDTWAGGASLEHTFDAWWTTRGGYVYESSRARSVERPIAGAEEEGFVSSARVFWGVRRDARDSPVMPTRGSLAGVRLAYSAPFVGSDLHFLEYHAQASLFIPAHRRLVLGLDASYTTRDVLDDSGSLPIQERLFLGGENSIRSYRESEVLPEGGLTSAMATAEARFQLRGRFWVAAFYDLGQVNPEAYRLDGTVGQAIGAGLRFQLPVGPIRGDVAYNPDRSAAKQNGYMGQFAVGFSF